MEFFRRAPGRARSLAILAGTFNPPTTAHMAMAVAALDWTDEVLFALPRVFPHKKYDGAGFDDRIRMLLAATAREPRFSVGAPAGGLFIEIARECRNEYPHDPALAFLCGSDAAERIVGWDYGRPGAFLEMLEEFELWVADRPHPYQPPPEMRHRIRRLRISPASACQEISATEVRKRIARGGSWEHFVPETIRAIVREIYS
jgi:nicotinate-nucleotide adenylyltransferase